MEKCRAKATQLMNATVVRDVDSVLVYDDAGMLQKRLQGRKGAVSSFASFSQACTCAALGIATSWGVTCLAIRIVCQVKN